MEKLEKSFYWLCFALLVYITIGFKLIPAVLKDQLIKNLDENLTQRTTIEKIEFNPFIFKLTVHGFKLSDSNDITSVTFKNFSVDFDAIKSIKRSSITFDGISLKDVFINIIEEKDGCYLVSAETFGKGIDMWLRSQGDLVEIVNEQNEEDNRIG